MEVEIRDNRQKEWFWLDNEYLNGYARLLGASCTVVYLSLCRHSDNQTQQCYPSIKLIAEENGISRDTVMRAIKKLEDWNIVNVKKSRKEDGTQANNIYTLTSKKVWKSKPSSIEQPSVAESQNEASPSRKSTPSRVAPEGYNNTNTNNTQYNNTSEQARKVSQVLKEMETLDPKIKNYYSNTTQRKACEFLIEEYQYEKVIQMIQTIPKLKSLPYMPSITTPCELRDKWQKVIDTVKREREKQKTKTKVIFT